MKFMGVDKRSGANRALAGILYRYEGRSSSNTILKMVTYGRLLCDVLVLRRMEPRGDHLCQATPAPARWSPPMTI